MRTNAKAILGGGLGTMLVLGTSLGAAAQQELGGFSWEPLGPVTETVGTEVHSIVALEDGRIVMTGLRCEPNHPCSPWDDATMMTWASDDGGATWTEAENDLPGLSDVVAHGDRLLAVDGERRVLTSTDGIAWEVLADLGQTVVDLSGIYVTPGGLLVDGDELKPEDGWGEVLAPHPTVWYSEDGEAWTASEVSGPFFGPDEGYATIVDAGYSDDGSWLVLGTAIDGSAGWTSAPIAWHGSPEAGWTQHSMPEEINYAVLLGSTPEGFIAGVQEQGDPQTGLGKTGLWLTRDGSDWEEILETAGPPEPVMRGTQAGTTIVGFQPAVDFADPDGPPTMTDGSPAYVTTDGRDWSDGELLDGINVTAAAAAPDGSVLVAGNEAPCREDPPDCIVFFPSDTERPILMRGTPN